MQTSLFDPPAALPVRQSDPITALIAARSVDYRARKREVLAALRLLGVASTASEIHQVVREYGSRMEAGSVRSRLNQLATDGLVRKQGVKVIDPPRGSGRPETTWCLTEVGARVAREVG